MDNSLVSVIIPCHNSEHTIRETVLSALNQSYKTIEIIMVDDFSSDNTLDELKKISLLDTRVTVVALASNQGAGIARNAALEIAKGRYIAFLDSDDIWDVNKLELQISFMERNCAPICYTSYTAIDEAGNLIPGGVSVRSILTLEEFLKSTEIGMSTAVVDKKAVGEFRLNVARSRQDAMLWIDLLSRNIVAYGLNRNLVQYRKRRGQISGNKFKMLYRTLRLYLSLTNMPLATRVYYYFCYVVNAVRKRL